jgi:parallel beta-helix repeat protein
MRNAKAHVRGAALPAADTPRVWGGAAVAPPPQSVVVSCGQTLTHSVRLANDLTDCSGAGLVVGADGITIDLDGHTIDGTSGPVDDCYSVPFGGSAGIDNDTGHDDLVVENGTVRQFANGFSADSETNGMQHSRLRELRLRQNRFNGISIGAPGRLHADNEIEDNLVSGNDCGFGIALTGAQRTHVAHNQVLDNGLGILICCSDHNVVEHNRVSGTDHDAVIVCCADDGYNVIRHNTVTRSAESGIVLCCSDGDQHNLVAHNAVYRNAHQGILLENANADQIVANDVFDNGDGIASTGSHTAIIDNNVMDAVGCPDQDGCGYGVVLGGGHGSLVAGNTVARTLMDGLSVASFGDTPPTVGNIVRDNRVRDASVDGISVQTQGEGPVGSLTLERNRALQSGDDGFDVRSAATTLTDNRAIHNADLGIDAVAGVTDGGGNIAAGNGNPLQCTNVFCR